MNKTHSNITHLTHNWCQVQFHQFRSLDALDWPDITPMVLEWIHTDCVQIGTIYVPHQTEFYAFWNRLSPALGLFTTTNKFKHPMAYDIGHDLVYIDTHIRWFDQGMPLGFEKMQDYTSYKRELQQRTSFEGMILTRDSIIEATL